MSLALLLLAGCIPAFPEVADPCGEWPEPGLYELEIDMPDKKRKVLVEIGASTGPRDLVVALHGGRQNAKEFMEVTQFSNLVTSGEEPLVIAYPQGRKAYFWRVWNAGPCCGNIDEEHRDALDVEFLDAIVKELEGRACVDRALGAGFSNGGMMAMRWGCESDVADAIVSAAGPLLTDTCPSETPIPLRAYHGTADDLVPLQGGTSPIGANDWPPAAKGWAIWRERNGCLDEVAESFQFGNMVCQRYAGCEEVVETCVIEGWGHAWPGGRNTAKLDSNATIESLNFLRANAPRDRDAGVGDPKPTPTDSAETGDTGTL